MINVLVLGASGMLGSMVLTYLRDQVGIDARGTVRGEIPESFRQLSHQLVRFDASSEPENQLAAIAGSFRPDFIINCIGIIKPHCQDNDPEGVVRAIQINALFPHALAQATAKVLPMAKVLQIATDCVYSGKTGNYDEAAKHDALDVYGKTKSLGEVNARHVLNIRCSIIGPELKGRLSLLEWFLSQPTGARVNGYAHHQWNGITTLQFAELCVMLMRGRTFAEWRDKGSRLNYVINETVDKYQLLMLMKEVYGKDCVIERVTDLGEPVVRTLSSILLPMEGRSMKQSLEQLRDYSDRFGWYQRTR